MYYLFLYQIKEYGDYRTIEYLVGDGENFLSTSDGERFFKIKKDLKRYLREDKELIRDKNTPGKEYYYRLKLKGESLEKLEEICKDDTPKRLIEEYKKSYK